ncbi:ThiF family adenylyltransferase [Evansella sp. LMS18]|uniref:ThiF family adenylyltransferase n=1 Tax=Evansella sp. LMS18 TaxID=2924033 RepID=UPI0020D09691|nr:ThiF family adenylyltransferase [Evansella sp. LMS18]UTR09409.1 ThiF family adenylyltransferase [Evansella sp. LMS18]
MEDWTRYSRQMLFKPIGENGQKKLKDSKVLIIGMGALGTVIANHLVRAGIGHVVFCDRDYVEKSNLQRQMLFDEEDVEKYMPKAAAAELKLKKLNSEVRIEGHVTDINADNVEEFIDGVDIIMDGTDNFQTRYLINDVAYKYNIPFVYGGAVSSRGMSALLIPGVTPCLRCLFPDGGSGGQTCDTIGVLAPVVDISASMQTIEALKYLTGNTEKLRGELATFDIWNNHSYNLQLGKRRDECDTCGKEIFPALTKREDDGVTTLCGRETVQILLKQKLDLTEWDGRLSPVAETKKTPFLLRARLKEEEITLVIFPDGRVLVQGTEDISRAKTVFSKYIGM